MGWEKRKNGRMYFYEGRWVNGRTVKFYIGQGFMAELAAQRLEARKLARSKRRDSLAAVKDSLVEAEEAITKLEQMPLSGNRTMPQPSQPSPEATPASLPGDVQDRIRTLLAARQAGDPAANQELARLVEQFPALWTDYGDLGQQAMEIWLNLISGGDQMVRAAVRQKANDLRKRFEASPDDPAGQLIVDRVIATWLQVAHADARAAQNSHLDLRTQDFLARRQQQAQRQHLSAIQAWRQWRRLAADLPSLGSPTPTETTAADADVTADKDPWILPFLARTGAA